MSSYFSQSDRAKVRGWMDDPVAFVVDNFGAQPDPWQAKVMRDLKVSRRAALVACKGPGKSCMKAWVAWWIMALNEDAQGFALSITSENLRDNLWKELSVWYQKSAFLRETFEVTAKRIMSRHRPMTWFLAARSFPRQADATAQANTLAGLHGSTPFIIMDEVGDYPLGVLGAAEGIFANEDANAYLLAGGNPTNKTGALFHIVSRDAARWSITNITGDPDDPMRSSRIDKQWAQDLIDQEGRDNPWVMVNVLGQFPPGAANQVVDTNLVLAAQERDATPSSYRDQAIVWGLDPARFGDDEIALARRQGVVCYRFLTWRGLNGTDLGDKVSQLLLEAQDKGVGCDTLFVDVGGNGASCYDRLDVLGWGHLLVPVDFGSSPDDPRYLNKRAEIWLRMQKWLRDSPANLPRDGVLMTDLTGPTFSFTDASSRQTRYVLESKEKMKKRGVQSPNRGDALALTFTSTVMPRSRAAIERAMPTNKARTDYDPYKRMSGVGEQQGPPALVNYDPLAPR